MNQVERREHNRDPKDELLPEVLALLKSCGAEIRESDRQRLAEAKAPNSRATDGAAIAAPRRFAAGLTRRPFARQPMRRPRDPCLSGEEATTLPSRARGRIITAP
jgi:hypothetical protein